MLGRIAESAGLGHSFQHNALMKWSTKKESKQQKASPPPPLQKKKKKSKTKNETAVVWN